jgi:hypothetical protein
MSKVTGDTNCVNDDNLFFAEVKCVRQEQQEEMLVNCSAWLDLPKMVSAMLVPTMDVST